MNKVKVLQIGLSYKAGGIESFLINYLDHIDETKIEMDFINIYKSAKKEKFYNDLSQKGTIYNLSSFKKYPFKFIKELKKLQSEKKYDIFHYNMNSAAYIVPLIAAKICGIKIVIAHSHNSSNDKGLLKTIAHNINKLFIPLFANKFFACSEDAGKWFFSKKILNGPDFYIIKNAIDTQKFSYDEKMRNIVRKELEIDDNAVVIGNVGRFKKQKNQLFLIDIFAEYKKRNKNSILLIVGFGDLEEKLKEKIKYLGLEESVKILGQRNDVNNIMQAMDIFVLPSLYEGLGIVLIEAQSAGLPCIVSNSIPKEAKITNEFFRCDVNDSPKKWANYIEKCDKLKRTEKNCDCYDIRKNSKELEKLYEKFTKIKICHFVNGIVNGGVERFILNYFNEIDKDNYDLHIISQGEEDQKCLEDFKKLGFTKYNVTKKKDSLLKNFKEIKKILKTEKFDIIHCHMSSTNLFPLFYGFLSGVKIRISHSHLSLKKVNFTKKVLIKLGNLFATNKFACSIDASKYLFGKSKDVTIVNNAIELDKFIYNEEIRNKIRKELKIENKKVIGHIGRFVTQKNHDFLIDLFYEISKENDDYELLLIGTGELEQKIKNKVQKLNLEKKVHFLGTRSDVNDLMQAIDIFVLPSLFEGLGIVLIEAQVSGLKCLCSDTNPNEVKITNNIEFLKLDIDLWKEKIINLNVYERKSYLKEISDKGFNIKIESKKLDELYKKMIRK